MEIRGRIIQILPLVSGTSARGEWKKQDFVLETLDQYPRKVCFNLFGDRIDQCNLIEGEEVTLFFELESREFNGRWYTDVRGRYVDRNPVGQAAGYAQPGYPQGGYAQAQPGFSQPAAPVAPASRPAAPEYGAAPVDDLPF